MSCSCLGATPVHDNEGSVSRYILSEDTTQRLKNVLSSRSREKSPRSLLAARYFFVASAEQTKATSGRRRGKEGDSLLSRGPGGEGTSLVFGQREECASLVEGAERPPALLRTPSIFTFTLLAIIIRMLWLHSLSREPPAPV